MINIILVPDGNRWHAAAPISRIISFSRQPSFPFEQHKAQDILYKLNILGLGISTPGALASGKVCFLPTQTSFSSSAGFSFRSKVLLPCQETLAAHAEHLLNS